MKLLKKILTIVYISLLCKSDHLSDEIFKKVKNILPEKIPIEISQSLLILRITYYNSYDNLKLFRNFDEFGFEYTAPTPKNYENMLINENLSKNNNLINKQNSSKDNYYIKKENFLEKENFPNSLKPENIKITNNMNELKKEEKFNSNQSLNYSENFGKGFKIEKKNDLNKNQIQYADFKKSKEENIPTFIKPLNEEKGNFHQKPIEKNPILKNLNNKEENDKIYQEKVIPNYMMPLNREKKNTIKKKENIPIYIKPLNKQKGNNFNEENIPHYMKPLNRQKKNYLINQNFPNYKKPLIKEKKDAFYIKKPNYLNPTKNWLNHKNFRILTSNSKIIKELKTNQKIVYNQYLNTLYFISQILWVNPLRYNKYNFILGNSNKKEMDLPVNFKAFFYTKNKLDNQFLVLRLKISKSYKIKKSIYEGQRVGNCFQDEEILDRFEKYIYLKEDFENGNVKNNIYSVEIKKFENFEYELKIYFKTREVFISFDIIEKENEEVIKNKILFYNKITSISMSKLALKKIGNIGFFNNNDKCYNDLKLLKYGGNNKKDFLSTGIHFIKKLSFFDFKRYNSSLVQNIHIIKNKCKRFNNKIINNGLEIGKRNYKFDLNFKIKIENSAKIIEFYFKAYDQDDYINYLVVFSQNSLFLSIDVEEYAKRNLDYENCYYRNDNYYTDYDFKEIYFLYFSKKKDSLLI